MRIFLRKTETVKYFINVEAFTFIKRVLTLNRLAGYLKNGPNRIRAPIIQISGLEAGPVHTSDSWIT